MPSQTGKYGYGNWPAAGRSASETKAVFWRSGPPGRGPRRRQRVDAHRRCFLLVGQGAFYLAEEGGSVFDNKVAVTSLHSIYRARPRAYFEEISPTPVLFLTATDDPVATDHSAQVKTFGDGRAQGVCDAGGWASGALLWGAV